MGHHIHFRICHTCGEVSEGHGRLLMQCQSCGKHLAPFYYFDESKALGLRPQEKTPYEQQMISTLPLSEYPPLVGLTAYWETGDG